MNILRYYEAKQQNRKIVDLLRELDGQGRLRELKGKWHDHYSKFPKIQHSDEDDQFDAYTYHDVDIRDKYLIRILKCSDTLNGHINKINGDVYITGSMTCDEKICAVCGTKQARRMYSQMSWLFNELKSENYKYMFLTFTLPNNMHGFAEEYKIYRKCLQFLLKYLGFGNEFKDFCYGAFGTYELTHSKEKGWHPHLHLCLAYKADEIKSIKCDRRGQIKKLVVGNKYRELETSAFKIRERFLHLINKYFPEYYRHVIIPHDEHLNIGFEPCYNIDDKCNELCKYFCDYSSFVDSNTLFEFMRDIYRFNKYVKVGCFGWSKDKEARWKLSLDKPKQNLHFIQYDINPALQNQDMVYFGQYYGMLNSKKTIVNVMYPADDVIKDVTFVYDRKNKCYVYRQWVDDELVPVKTFTHDDLKTMCYEPREDMSRLLYLYTNLSKGGTSSESSG